MNFREHYFTLLERFGLDAMYVPPKDKQYQLYDFYALSLINPYAFLDEEAQDYFKQAKEAIINETYKDFIDAVYFSLASELYHIGDASTFPDMTDSEIKDAGINLTPKEKNTLIKLKYIDDFIDDIPDRVTRNDEMRNIFSPIEMANFAIKIFQENIWEDGFGGKAWQDIAKGYKRLVNAKSMPDKMVAIDHVYDLQHNNDTVFDKVQEYYNADKGGYRWLKNALDDKARIKEPHVYLDKTSPQLYRPLAYAFKELYGKTLEGFKYEQEQEHKKRTSDYMKKWNVEPEYKNIIEKYLNALDILKKYNVVNDSWAKDRLDILGINLKNLNIFKDKLTTLEKDRTIRNINGIIESTISMFIMEQNDSIPDRVAQEQINILKSLVLEIPDE